MKQTPQKSEINKKADKTIQRVIKLLNRKIKEAKREGYTDIEFQNLPETLSSYLIPEETRDKITKLINSNSFLLKEIIFEIVEIIEKDNQKQEK